MNNEISLLAIIAAECKSTCADEPDLLERIKKAMSVVIHGSFMTTNEDLCMRGAIAAVMLDPNTTEEDNNRIKFTLKQMQALTALIQGLPIDIERAMANPDDIEIVPFMKIWRDLKNGSAPQA